MDADVTDHPPASQTVDVLSGSSHLPHATKHYGTSPSSKDAGQNLQNHHTMELKNGNESKTKMSRPHRWRKPTFLVDNSTLGLSGSSVVSNSSITMEGISKLEDSAGPSLLLRNSAHTVRPSSPPVDEIPELEPLRFNSVPHVPHGSPHKFISSPSSPAKNNAFSSPGANNNKTLSTIVPVRSATTPGNRSPPKAAQGPLLHCDKCDFSTTRISNLVFHQRQHSGNKNISDYSPKKELDDPHPRELTSSPTRPVTSLQRDSVSPKVVEKRPRRSASSLADLRNKEIIWNMNCSSYFDNKSSIRDQLKGGPSRGGSQRAGHRHSDGSQDQAQVPGRGRGRERGQHSLVEKSGHMENIPTVQGHDCAESQQKKKKRGRSRGRKRASLTLKRQKRSKQKIELPSLESSDESFLTKDQNQPPRPEAWDHHPEVVKTGPQTCTSDHQMSAPILTTCDPNIALDNVDCEATLLGLDGDGGDGGDGGDSGDSGDCSSGSSCEDDLPNVFTPSQQANIAIGDILWVKAYGYPFWPAVVKTLYKKRHRVVRLSVGFISRNPQHKVSRRLVYNKKNMVVFGGDHETHERLVKDAQLSAWNLEVTDSIHWVEEFLFDQAKAKLKVSSQQFFGFDRAEESDSDLPDDDEAGNHGNPVSSHASDNMLPGTEAPELDEVSSDVEMSARLKACIDRRRERCARILDVCRGDEIKVHLAEIYHGKKPSFRHDLYNKRNRTPQEEQAFKSSTFGPIDDDGQQSELISIMTELFQKLQPDTEIGDRCLYMLHVLIPEAIIYGIQVALRRARERAEEVFRRGVLYTKEELRQQSMDMLRDKLTEEEEAQWERRLARTAQKLGIHINGS